MAARMGMITVMLYTLSAFSVTTEARPNSQLVQEILMQTMGSCRTIISSGAGCCESEPCFVRDIGDDYCYCDIGCYDSSECCLDIEDIGCYPETCARGGLSPGGCTSGDCFVRETGGYCYCDDACRHWSDCCCDVPGAHLVRPTVCDAPTTQAQAQELEISNLQSQLKEDMIQRFLTSNTGVIENSTPRRAHPISSSQTRRTRPISTMARSQNGPPPLAPPRRTRLISTLARSENAPPLAPPRRTRPISTMARSQNAPPLAPPRRTRPISTMARSENAPPPRRTRPISMMENGPPRRPDPATARSSQRGPLHPVPVPQTERLYM